MAIFTVFQREICLNSYAFESGSPCARLSGVEPFGSAKGVRVLELAAPRFVFAK